MEYGVIGTNHAPGKDSIAAFLPDARFTGNVIANADAGRYPSGNRFPSASEFRGAFRGYDDGDYRLAASSAWRGADGREPGADIGALPRQP
jgi:hypothetical protein